MAIARIATHYGVDIPMSIEAEIKRRGMGGIAVLDGKSVTLSTLSGSLIGTRDPDVVSLEKVQTETEEFVICAAQDRKAVAFKTSTGRYLCTNADGKLGTNPHWTPSCNFKISGASKELAKDNRGCVVGLTSDNKYLCKGPDNTVSSKMDADVDCLFRLKVVKRNKRLDSKSNPLLISEKEGLGTPGRHGIGTAGYSRLGKGGEAEGSQLLNGEGRAANDRDGLLPAGYKRCCCSCCNCCFLQCPSCVCSCCIVEEEEYESNMIEEPTQGYQIEDPPSAEVPF